MSDLFKNRAVLLFLLLSVNLVAINSQNVYLPVDTLRLNTSFRKLERNPSDARLQRAFFDAFPRTWAEYICTYQYCGENSDLTMYSLADKHVRTFGKLNAVADTAYYSRLVDLCVGARIDADAPSCLQILVEEKLISNTKEIMSYLMTLRKGHRMQFWQFVFSTIHDTKLARSRFEKIRERVKENSPEELELVDTAYRYFHNGVNFLDVLYLKDPGDE